MVTDTLRGCTVSWTHCSRSEAKRWGSSARSQASCREQLRAQGAMAGWGEGSQRGTPSLPAPAQQGNPHPHLEEPSSFTWYPVFTGVKVGRPSLSQSQATSPRGDPGALTGELQRPQCGHEGPPRSETARALQPTPAPHPLTCCVGHTSRSGGPVIPGTARMMYTAHSFPRAPGSPARTGSSASGPRKALPRDRCQPTSSPSLCVCYTGPYSPT